MFLTYQIFSSALILKAAQKIFAQGLLETHFFLNCLEAGYCEIEIFLGVSCGNLSPDSCLSLRNYRIGKAGYINALLQHPVSEFSSNLGVIEHNCYDGMMSGEKVEADFFHFCSEVCGVFVNLIS